MVLRVALRLELDVGEPAEWGPLADVAAVRGAEAERVRASEGNRGGDRGPWVGEEGRGGHVRRRGGERVEGERKSLKFQNKLKQSRSHADRKKAVWNYDQRTRDAKDIHALGDGTIQLIQDKAKDIKSTITTLSSAPDPKIKKALQDCSDSYDEAVGNVNNAHDSFSKNDNKAANINLAAVLDNVAHAKIHSRMEVWKFIPELVFHMIMATDMDFDISLALANYSKRDEFRVTDKTKKSSVEVGRLSIIGRVASHQ
ncbi:hypothetical protein Syun_018797 [Stephania yunnanensis]|uniref:Pectinesterase inhibitor domain-containing protein n=1 Tax=Stephania yunnanensis TaxID=152371 RepID=A0AAP0NXC5_9MAGN